MIDEKKLFTEIANSLTQKELKDYILKYCRNEKSQIITFLNYFENKINIDLKSKYVFLIDLTLEGIINSRSRFLIDPKKCTKGLKPIFNLLKEKQSSYIQKPYDAFLVSTYILERFSPLYEYFYTVRKFDIAERLLFNCVEIIESIYYCKDVPYEFKDEIFKFILEFVQESYFSDNKYYMDSKVDIYLLKVLCKNSQKDKIDLIDESINKKLEVKTLDETKRKIIENIRGKLFE